MASKKWTILAYLAGDNELDEDGEGDINEMAKVGSNDSMNVVVQFDRAGDLGTRRFYITENGGYTKDVVQELGETDTGDPRVLIDFLEWGLKKYPAEHYMVVLWGHGSGWKDDIIYQMVKKFSPERKDISTFEKRKIRRGSRAGIRRVLFSTTVKEIVKLPERLRVPAYGNDDGSMNFLDNLELKRALKSALSKSKVKKFDILGFDACLMNTLEVCYQLKDLANIAIGSEDEEPGEGWPYDLILKALAEKPDMIPKELAVAVVDEYIKSYDTGSQRSLLAVTTVGWIVCMLLAVFAIKENKAHGRIKTEGGAGV